jgi:hypothetical protein
MFAACTDVATAHNDVDRAFELSVHAGDAMQHERKGIQCRRQRSMAINELTVLVLAAI